MPISKVRSAEAGLGAGISEESIARGSVLTAIIQRENSLRHAANGCVRCKCTTGEDFRSLRYSVSIVESERINCAGMPKYFKCWNGCAAGEERKIGNWEGTRVRQFAWRRMVSRESEQ